MIPHAHSTFITGLEFMPSKNPESQMVCGYTDASVLSISCDNEVLIHHIPRRGESTRTISRNDVNYYLVGSE